MTAHPRPAVSLPTPLTPQVFSCPSSRSATSTSPSVVRRRPSRSTTTSRSTSRKAATPRSWDRRGRGSPRCSISWPVSTSRRAGTVRVAGAEVSSMSAAQLAAWRARTIGFVFQSYNLLPVLTARAERRASAAAHEPEQEGSRRADRDRPRRRGAVRPDGPLSAPALRRAGAACRHRARHRRRSDAHPARRADRPARLEELRRSAGAAPAAQRGVPQDHHDGHARREGGGQREDRAASGQGRAPRARSGGESRGRPHHHGGAEVVR